MSIKAKAISIYKSIKTEDLKDVLISAIADNSILIFDASTSKFTNITLAEAIAATYQFKQEVVSRDAGSDTDFTLEEIPVTNSLMIFIDGVYQNQTFYSIINNKTVRFNFEVDTGSTVTVIYQYAI